MVARDAHHQINLVTHHQPGIGVAWATRLCPASSPRRPAAALGSTLGLGWRGAALAPRCAVYSGSNRHSRRPFVFVYRDRTGTVISMFEICNHNVVTDHVRGVVTITNLKLTLQT